MSVWWISEYGESRMFFTNTDYDEFVCQSYQRDKCRNLFSQGILDLASDYQKKLRDRFKVLGERIEVKALGGGLAVTLDDESSSFCEEVQLACQELFNAKFKLYCLNCHLLYDDICLKNGKCQRCYVPKENEHVCF